ncbi:hypothetical protein AMECASPLE_033186 [Ameca splendens]|uniref:Uncharacterized protein n=1 Tax=Ameca splendens TaxID=208324 RepID=A0ABV0YII0_9TELE
MPLFAASRRDGDGRCGRHRAPSDGERLRSVRERLELIVSGLAELEYLRRRQELLVLSALKEEAREMRSAAQLNCEENILVLRKQLVGNHDLLSPIRTDLYGDGLLFICTLTVNNQINNK